MTIHFTEHEDLIRRRTVLSAYTMVGNRKVCSRMYLSFENYHQNNIDAAYHQLKDEVRRRALNEMRVQQIYDPRHVDVPSEPIALVRFIRYNYTKPLKDVHDWKKEGF